MRKIAALLMAVVLTLILAGCSPGPDPEPPESPETPDEPVSLEYQDVEDMDTLPQEVQRIIPFLKEHRGYYVFGPSEYETGEDTMIVVFAGEKPTGGYDLIIDTVEVENNTLQIVVEEVEPDPSDHVIQVLTYPTAAVLVSQEFNQYEVVNTENVSFEPISPDVIPEIKEGKGVYQGLQDSNSAEILVEDQPMALRFSEHFSAFDELLNFGDNVVFTYYENEHGQNILVDIDTAEKANMNHGVEGVFQGHIDSQSVEITIDGVPMAFVPVE